MMKILSLGTQLEPVSREMFENSGNPAVVVANSEEARDALKLTGVHYEGEISLAEVGFCRIETQQECLFGSLHIPKLLDVLGSSYKMLFLVSENHVVIIDDDGFAQRIIRRIRQKKAQQGVNKAHFIYNFILQFMSRDLQILGQYERHIMAMEEQVMEGKTEGFQSKIMPIRKELLTLREYYDELMDMGKELEENENGFFAKKQLKYFGTISDRADRLMGRAEQLLEYAKQVQDAYQAQVDANQNKNMEFLTVISTIFFPLTLITGWFGMNFENMPGLKGGYPGVIILSLVVVTGCILFFKKKKML